MKMSITKAIQSDIKYLFCFCDEMKEEVIRLAHVMNTFESNYVIIPTTLYVSKRP